MLVVDDEPGILTSLRALLKGFGIDVDTADNVGDAVMLLNERRHDVVISDIRLNDPMGVSGLGLLKYVKDTLPETDVIMVTGYATPYSTEKAHELGAAFYFEKPLSVTALYRALTSLGLNR